MKTMKTMKTMNAIKFLSEGTSTISLIKKSDFKSDYDISLEYSYDGADWSKWDFSGLTFNSGVPLYIRGNNPNGFSSIPSAYYTFIIEGDNVSCSGNIMSLINYTNTPDVIPCSFCFYGLFENCNALTTAPELPATELKFACYSYMFYGCSSLTTAPELPAMTLAKHCYGRMFSGCTSITTAPELPATTLKARCYDSMFSGCTSLTTAPELPATNLAEWCYDGMFYGCTSLKDVPTELADNCFSTFQDCIMLKDNKWTEF